MYPLAKNKSHNYITKLFKITDHPSASAFPTEEMLFSTIDQLENLTGLKPTDFCLNYSKDFKTRKGFKEAISKVGEIVYGSVAFDSNNTGCYFSTSNAMLNYTHRPKYSSIDFCLQIRETDIQQEQLEVLCNELMRKYGFEYGYIHRYPANIDAITERPVKRGLFSTTAAVTKSDHTWTFHSIAIQHGYLKRLYHINFLNQSQLSCPEIAEAMRAYGHSEAIDERISVWRLSDAEIEALHKSPSLVSRLIQINEQQFLESEDAKEFRDLMKLEAE